LKPTGDAIAHRLFRDFQPDREVQSGTQSRQDGHQAFGLSQRPGKTIEHKSVTAMQAQPIFD
jgi:hypothetical protein